MFLYWNKLGELGQGMKLIEVTAQTSVATKNVDHIQTVDDYEGKNFLNIL